MVKIMENPMNKMDDLGVPLFLETSIYTYILLANIYANARVWMLRSLCYKYCTNLPKKRVLSDSFVDSNICLRATMGQMIRSCILRVFQISGEHNYYIVT